MLFDGELVESPTIVGVVVKNTAPSRSRLGRISMLPSRDRKGAQAPG